MAELGEPRLIWTDDTLDPGVRRVDLPLPLPEIGDDFDWEQRDYASFRGAMWRELQERFPDRRRWTPGDVEAVLVDVLAYGLDQLSDMADRVSAEAYLASARRMGVIAWLEFIGYEPARRRGLSYDQLLDFYSQNPRELELDRQRGPTSIRCQRRMVSLSDYNVQLEQHPLVSRAFGRSEWNGSWFELTAVVSLRNDWRLEDRLVVEPAIPQGADRVVSDDLKSEIEQFHDDNRFRMPVWGAMPTIRLLVGDQLRAFRMAGQVVHLDDIVAVPVVIEVVVIVRPEYFQSEVRREVQRVLGRGPTGFFRPGRLAVGEDLQLGDLYGAVMPLDGVDAVETLRFSRQTDPAPVEVPQTIPMGREELAECTGRTDHGEVIVRVRGGRRG